METTALATNLATLQAQLVDSVGDLVPYFLAVIGGAIGVGLLIFGAKRGYALLKGFAK
ncbi:MAG: hypothetical protein RBS17_11105 [Coriobacteriia bacterium]|nr:hypothetical protein [Coriobacteriia bacterium]